MLPRSEQIEQHSTGVVRDLVRLSLRRTGICVMGAMVREALQ